MGKGEGWMKRGETGEVCGCGSVATNDEYFVDS